MLAAAHPEGGLQVHFKGENKETAVGDRSNLGPITAEPYQSECPFSSEFCTEEKLLEMNSRAELRQ